MTQTILRKVDVKTWRKNQVKVDMPVSIECLDQDKIRLIYYPMTGDFFRQVGERAVKENPTEIWEQLEVPVAGVTDEEIKDYSWKWAEDNNGHGPDKYFADCNFRCGATWMRDKLSVTGNKPLKVEESWPAHQRLFNVLHDLGLIATQDDMRQIIDAVLSDKTFTGDTLDKEELLKQAVKNIAEKKQYDHDDTAFGDFEIIKEVADEYLRLCTGGGEKE